jgi:transcription-repair coupling factor (superfamily II helicase)
MNIQITNDTLPLFLIDLMRENNAPIAVVTADPLEAQRLPSLIRQIDPKQKNCFHLPSWETLPYDRFSPHADLTSDRLNGLLQIKDQKSSCIFIAANTLLYRLMPKTYLDKHAHHYTKGMQINLTHLISTLTESGYYSVNAVYEHGSFSNRGSILDIFPMGSHKPIRLDFFDNEIESIRVFDTETQCSLREINTFSILPAEEYPLNDEGISRFRQAWRENFTGNPMDAPVYQNISQHHCAPGAEYYLPLFYPKLDTFFDYLPKNTRIVLTPDAIDSFKKSYHSLCNRYESLRYDQQHPLCTPNSIAMNENELLLNLSNFSTLKLETSSKNPIPPIQIDHRNQNPLKRFTEFLDSTNNQKVIICAETIGRKTVLIDLLCENKLYATDGVSWEEAHASDKKLLVIAVAFQAGFELHDIIYITEQELFGSKQAQLQREDSKQKIIDPNTLIRNLVELHIGDPVVHRQHGIGRYQGLESITTDGIEAEYLLLEYANHDKLYVPVTALQFISRYLGADAEHTTLSRLGPGSWEQAVDKAKKRIHDIAAELLVTYSKREHSQGFSFHKPNAEFLQFRASFPFSETPDQRKTIDHIIADMTSEKTMDRLVCGDVGFGKTEVAMQAAFLAIQSHKQVAVLAPTTLLANQHLKNFEDRFANWPIRIGLCSRAITGKALSDLKSHMAQGSLDIIIGTHKLLNPEIKFKALGLLIVDEEHRFGVSDKEKIKTLRNNIDILTMTATPIPRTLNMALSQMRDLSIIATPPAQRLAIKTFIRPYRSELIKESIERELSRGGQVYFLHNDISTMPQIEESLKALIPGLRTVTAHGQMSESHLERVMTSFYHQQHQVLITTTIIESGIDVPNANTILINHADKFGLAQLHQLRGRVGRSHHQAYAFLLTDPHRKLTKDSAKRLEALEMLTDLGSGFALAMQDLEIRGAGELLGDEQSGHIQKIGFSLYLELLDEAMKSLNAQETGKEVVTFLADVDLGISSLLTADYVPDVADRLTLYKRLSSANTNEAIDSLKAELIDRFGPLNSAGNNLLSIAKLRLLANSLGVSKIRTGREYGQINFNESADINHKALIKLIQLQPKNYQLHKQTQLRYRLKNACPIQQCQDVLMELKPLTIY